MKNFVPFITHHRTLLGRKTFELMLFLGFSVMASNQRVLADTAIQISASIRPIAQIVSEVGGAYVEVQSLVPAGKDPHTFELKPSDMTQVEKADLLVMNGLGLEFWAGSLFEEKKAKLFVLEDVLGRKKESNPHLWLNPVLIVDIIGPLTERLCAIRPKQCPNFESQASRFRERLQILIEDIRSHLVPYQGESFAPYHPAWGLFAEEFGLHELQGFKEGESHSLKIREYEAIAKEISQRKIHALLVEPSQSPSEYEAVVHDLHLVPVEVDSQGTWGDSYEHFMKKNLEGFRKALSLE